MPTPEEIAELRRRHREQGRKIRAAERSAGVTAADKNRLAAAERSRAASAEGAEIGPPPPRDEERYERYRNNLFLYLCECFPLTTSLTPLSLDHKRVAERLQETFFDGGRELIIMPRGFVKSTLIENACTWGAGYGHTPFIVPISATVDLAKQALESFQFEFETNDHLMALFPEACHAAEALEGIPQRAKKQTIDGVRTYIHWTSKRCVLPTVEGFAGSGSIVWPKAINSVRGMRFKRPDGTQQRPTTVFCDDLQTDDTAANPNSCAKIIKKLKGTVARLAGPRATLGIALAGTVIEPDDAIDQLSDAKRFPSWRTMRVAMLKKLPRYLDEEWLGKYSEILTSFDPDNDADRKRAVREANAYYKANREQMDDGAIASWENCFDPKSEISAIQHAMNIWVLDGEEAFMAECQGAPLKDAGALEMLNVDQICKKQWAFSAGTFPKSTSVLVAHVDVHRGILYSEVWGFQQDFTGGRVDEFFFPDQHRKHFAHRSIRRRLKHLFPGLSEEATVIAGLDAFLHGWEDPRGKDSFPGLMKMQWKRQDDVVMRIRCCLVDANGEYRDPIAQLLSTSAYSENLHPSFGQYVGARDLPMSARPAARLQKGVGPGWYFGKPRAGEIRPILFDANYHKSEFHRALAAPPHAQGGIYLPKVTNATDHRMAAEHYTAEKGVEVTVEGRTVTEFTEKPNRDNHKLDNAVACRVAASRCGITNVKTKAARARKKKRGGTFYG